MDAEDIEIDLSARSYRLFEMLPGALVISSVLLIIIFAVYSPYLFAVYVIIFDLFWLIRSILASVKIIEGYFKLKQNNKINWDERILDLGDVKSKKQELTQKLKNTNKLRHESIEKNYLKFLNNLDDSIDYLSVANSVVHVVIVTIYNETEDIVGPTLQSIIESSYDHSKIIIVLAYEERGGREAKETVDRLNNKYSSHFRDFLTICHPDSLPDEIKGKGSNLYHAGKYVSEYCESNNINDNDAIITTLDADNRPTENYFSYLTYMYSTCADKLRTAFQPIAMFNNNIWDVSLPMRLMAVGNSFWNMGLSVKPHIIRNFSSHSQGLSSLKETNFWSRKTIVEDGHQFWRSYFTFGDRYAVLPLLTPIMQDAVLAGDLKENFVAQFKQIQRWSWGVSDVPYVITKSIRDKSINIWDKLFKIIRLVEGHYTWAMAPFILTLSAWVPLLLSPNSSKDIVIHQLPIIVSRIHTITAVGILISMSLTILTLPIRPIRYGIVSSLSSLFQWLLLPVISIIFGSFAAISSQYRLFIGKYIGEFVVTEKKVRK
jgi:hypothetical protein